MTDGEKSLEDFFAKKSKKKGGKGKGKKFTTSDEIAKKLVEQPAQDQVPEKAESTTKKVKELSKDEKEKANMNYRFQDDDEWTDFRDDVQKDYSGLKVQALQIVEEPVEVDEEEEVDENGDPIKSKGQGPVGPWNKQAQELGSNPAQAQAQAPAVPTPAPEPEPPKEEPKPAAPSAGKYIPPSKRGAAAASSSSASAPGSGAAPRQGMARKGKAPQINSEFEFPSLAASSDLAKHSNKVEDATFSTVTRGGQQLDSSAAKAGDLALENRFAALEK